MTGKIISHTQGNTYQFHPPTITPEIWTDLLELLWIGAVICQRFELSSIPDPHALINKYTETCKKLELFFSTKPYRSDKEQD